jgi:hypothetical protein
MDLLLAQVTLLEVHVQTLSSTLVDNIVELRAKALSSELNTTTKDDYQRQNVWLTKKIDCESPFHFHVWFI